MKHFKLAIAAATLVLTNMTLVPPGYAADQEAVYNNGNIKYVSGGVGSDSTERLTSLAKDFNLKLVFALKSGDYVSGVDVNITDAAGKALVSTMSEGPWFLVRLPAGNFKIGATYEGKTEVRTIAVGAEKLRTVDFRWSGQ